MDKVGQRGIIKYLSLKGLTPRQVHEDLVVALGNTASSYTAVKSGLLNLGGVEIAWMTTPGQEEQPLSLLKTWLAKSMI